MESILHLSFMFYNDCKFISKHIERINASMKMEQMKAQQAKKDNNNNNEEKTEASASPSSSSSSLLLVDLSAPLRHLGEKYFLLHLTRQRNSVTELLDSLGTLSDIEDDSVYHTARQSVEQTLHQLSTVEKIWHQLMGSHTHLLLPPPLTPAVDAAATALTTATSLEPRSNGWNMHIGLLLEAITSRLVSVVLEKTDLSVEAANRIHLLFALITAQYKNVEVSTTQHEQTTKHK